MSLSNSTKKKIIKNVITNQDYRDDIIVIIQDIFLNYCIEFFKKVTCLILYFIIEYLFHDSPPFTLITGWYWNLTSRVGKFHPCY